MNHKDVKLAIVGAGRAFLLAAGVSFLMGNIGWGLWMLLVAGTIFVIWRFYEKRRICCAW